jgi:hypothetical protein
MASSELIQELIRAHVDRNDQRFRTIALQLTAREARSGPAWSLAAYATFSTRPGYRKTHPRRTDAHRSNL